MTKTAEKPYPFGAAHTYIAHIREYPSPGNTHDLSRVDTSSSRPVIPEVRSRYSQRKRIRITGGQFVNPAYSGRDFFVNNGCL